MSVDQGIIFGVCIALIFSGQYLVSLIWVLLGVFVIPSSSLPFGGLAMFFFSIWLNVNKAVK